MPNSTPLISNAAAGDDASGGGTNDEETVGVLCHYSTTASRAPPRLELKVDAPLLRLIKKFTRPHGAQVGVPRAEEEDHGEHARRKGRRKLGRVAARSLQIGQRKIAGTDEVEIVAKFLYKKPKKIVLQMRRGDDRFVKINILWSSIQTMDACFDDVRFDTLRIQVKSSSEQYCADRPPAGMHLQWRRLKDVTLRTFCLQFDKGSLERSYGKMLYTDPSLILLTLPPASYEEDEEAAQATARQTHMISAAAPVPHMLKQRYQAHNSK